MLKHFFRRKRTKRIVLNDGSARLGQAPREYKRFYWLVCGCKAKVFGLVLFYLFFASKLLTVLRTNARATEVSEGQKRGDSLDAK